jgi:hypothetical protein
MRDPIRIQLRMISSIHLNTDRGVMHRQMRPELLPHPLRGLRSKDLLIVELNTLDLFEETLDIPALVVRATARSPGEVAM